MGDEIPDFVPDDDELLKPGPKEPGKDKPKQPLQQKPPEGTQQLLIVNGMPMRPPENEEEKAALEQAFRQGAIKKGPRLTIFGIVYDEYRPTFKGMTKNYLTEVRIFQVHGVEGMVGFYGQAIVTTGRRTSGGMVPSDTLFPIKIDIENKQFLIIEKENGTKMEHNFKDRLQVENIDKMIDLVITKIVQEPEAELQYVEIDPEADMDDADYWKQGKDDPDWWKKGKEDAD